MKRSKRCGFYVPFFIERISCKSCFIVTLYQNLRDNESVWASNNRYYINGKSVALPIKKNGRLFCCFFTNRPEIENERKLALRYLCSGAPIPQTLLRKLERVKRMVVE